MFKKHFVQKYLGDITTKYNTPPNKKSKWRPKEELDETNTKIKDGWFTRRTKRKSIPDGIVKYSDAEHELFVSKYKNLPYKDFLKSPYWLIVKQKVLSRDKYRCSKCGHNRFLQIHHLTYKNHLYEHKNLQDLIIVCKTCHEKEHGLKKNTTIK